MSTYVSREALSLPGGKQGRETHRYDSMLIKPNWIRIVLWEHIGIGMHGNMTMTECSLFLVSIFFFLSCSLSVSLSPQALGPRAADQDQPGASTPGFLAPSPSGTACVLSALLLSLSFCVRRNGWHYSTPTVNPCCMRACPSSLGRMAVGVSAGWPSVSRPDGRRTLAAWRGLICAR